MQTLLYRPTMTTYDITPWLETSENQPDFLAKPLHDMTETEWESLCDGCGLCCQIRVEDGTTGKQHISCVACRLLCLKTHQCSHYTQRHAYVQDCIKITPDNVLTLDWLPPTCAYRLTARGMPLPHWHHLICGDRDTVHQQGASMLGQTVSEDTL